MAVIALGVDEAVERVGRRLRRNILLNTFAAASLFASAAGMAALIAFRYTRFRGLFCVLAFYAAAAVFAAVRARLARIDPFAIARFAEERLDLKERLSSAIALRDEGARVDPAFFRLQRRDAEAIARRLADEDPAPLDLRRNLAIILAGVAAVFAAALLSSLIPASGGGPAAVDLSPAGRALQSSAQRIDRALPAGSPVHRDTSQMQRIGDQMRRGEPPAQAHRDIAQASEDASSTQRELAGSADQPAGTAGETGRDIQQAMGSPDASGARGSAQQTIRRGAASMQSPGASSDLPQMLHQLAGDIDRDGKDPAARAQDARQLEKLSQGLDRSGLPKTGAQVDQASRQLASGDRSGASSQLRRAADTARQEQAEQKALSDVRKALSEADQDVSRRSTPSGAGSRQNAGGSEAGTGGQPQGAPGSGGAGEKAGGSNAPGAGSQASQQAGSSGATGDSSSGGGSGATGQSGQGGPAPAGENAGRGGAGSARPNFGAPHRLAGYDPAHSSGFDRVIAPPGAGAATVRQPGTGAPLLSGPSSVPYTNVYPAAKQAAETAMDHEQIPPAYKRNVDAYFKGIAPSH